MPLKYTEVGETLLPRVESQPLTTPQSKAMLLIMCGNSSKTALLAFRKSGTSHPEVYRPKRCISYISVLNLYDIQTIFSADLDSSDSISEIRIFRGSVHQIV